jgi:hypothetical protein
MAVLEEIVILQDVQRRRRCAVKVKSRGLKIGYQVYDTLRGLKAEAKYSRK